MGSKYTTKSEKTKQFIIQKTAPIFNKKGYSGTSISDLTEATGLTKGGIYGNFANKDEVALCAFRYNAEFIINMIQRGMNAAPTFFDKLMVYPKLYRKLAQNIIDYGGCPIINTLVESDDTHEDLRRQAVQIIELWKKTIVSHVKEGIKAGEFQNTADPEKTAELVISLIEGAVAMTKATGNKNYITTATDHLEQVISSIRK